MVHVEAAAVGDDVFVAPGDTVEVAPVEVKGEKDAALRIGPGLTVIPETQLRAAGVLDGDASSSGNTAMLQVVVPGDLRRKGNMVWVDGVHKRALPAEGDYVIGIITGTPGENYNVDIGGSCNATASERLSAKHTRELVKEMARKIRS
ncbi:hypothetical protein PTSG_05821 [Salpingoeca rosetta]|uniref:Uncharacterized protein n=1 Tax=Salpingoeca rosetta (strain ATCC 50818 / BSB-021) TaxID=946362 RepID=F2UCW2_SALR5|nr:uncharacterized protein PTSG_05821 [Salpingoeca rosetta]EGD74457.1 hypothetical protein PTSG_05821 [Salpingoeca rosetta]|eukprot:XP_004992714.1 hypothetical protein PTSG_05821 [Salpingoeca rosetta]